MVFLFGLLLCISVWSGFRGFGMFCETVSVVCKEETGGVMLIFLSVLQSDVDVRGSGGVQEYDVRREERGRGLAVGVEQCCGSE